MHLTVLARKYCPRTKWMSNILNSIKLKKIKRFILPENMTRAGEVNAERKSEVVYWCKQHWKKEYTNVQKDVKKHMEMMSINDYTEHEPIFSDMMFCYFAYGFTADEYFSFDLRNKNAEERRRYISDRYRNMMAIKLNDFFNAGIFLDKYQTYLTFGDAFKRDVILIRSDADKQDFLLFVEQHPNIVKKRVDLARGESVELISLGEKSEEREQLFRKIRQNGTCILEEKIEQADALAVFHPASVNTVRCVVIWTKDHVEIPYCILRTGRGNSIIDNASAGGISAVIDPETGLVITDGMDERNCRYRKHPDGQVVFKGYQLPDWDSFLSLIRDIATRKEGIRFIGWDLAYSIKGWCVVEGNYAPQLEARQVVCGGMKEEFERIVGKALK